MKTVIIALCLLLFSTQSNTELAIQAEPEVTNITRVEEYDSSQEEFEALCVALTPTLNQEDIAILANVLYGEAGGVKSTTQQSAVVWCILNRVDAGYGSIKQVVTAPHQFGGYNANRRYTTQAQINQYNHCVELVTDVLLRWQIEKTDYAYSVGRTLPSDYLWFVGFDGENHFENQFRSRIYWDWSLGTPYDN